MSPKPYSTEQVIAKLRWSGVKISQSKTVSDACRAIGVVQQT
jgi:hypothetical protein